MASKSRGKKADNPSETIESTREISGESSPPEETWRILASAIATMALAGLASPVSQANLSPVYGAIPSSIYHQMGINVVLPIVFLLSRLRTQSLNWSAFLPVMAYYIPVIQWALFPYSSRLGAELGPLLTECLTFYPLLLLAYLATSSILAKVDSSSPVRTIAGPLSTVFSYGFFYASQQVSTSTLPEIIGKADFLSRTGLSLLIGTGYAFLGKSQWLLLCSPAMLHTLFMNPHHASSVTNKVLNKTLTALDYTMMERRDSLTGYVSVLEDGVNGYRVLRCDHSLLGGEWLVTEERKQTGQTQRETIYSVFTMLESVRLVEGEKARIDSESSALFM